jgi:hypothetical protein
LFIPGGLGILRRVPSVGSPIVDFIEESVVVGAYFSE